MANTLKQHCKNNEIHDWQRHSNNSNLSLRMLGWQSDIYDVYVTNSVNRATMPKKTQTPSIQSVYMSSDTGVNIAVIYTAYIFTSLPWNISTNRLHIHKGAMNHEIDACSHNLHDCFSKTRDMQAELNRGLLVKLHSHTNGPALSWAIIAYTP